MNQNFDFMDFLASDGYEDFKIRVDNEICNDVTSNILTYYLNLEPIMTDHDVLLYREYQKKMDILRDWIPNDYDPLDGFLDPEGDLIRDYILYLEGLSDELELKHNVKDYISYCKKMRKFILMRAEEKNTKHQAIIPTYIYNVLFSDTLNGDLLDGIIMCFMIGLFFSKQMVTKGLPVVQDFISAKYELITLFGHLEKKCNSSLFRQYRLLDLNYEKNLDYYTYCFIAGKLRYSYEELEKIEEQKLKAQREIENIYEEYRSKNKFGVEKYIDEEEVIMNALANGDGELYGF